MNVLNFVEDSLRAFEVLRGGGVGILPMDVGYSIVGGSAASLQRIFNAKRRAPDKLNAMLGNTDLHEELHIVNSRGSDIVKAICEDYDLPLGLIARCRRDHPLFKSIDQETYTLSTRNDTLLMLMNAGNFHAAITGLSYSEGHLLFGSSANLTLTGTKFRVEDMQPEIVAIADIVVDYGLMKYHPYGQSSTLLDVETLEVHRYGVCYENIVAILEKHFSVELPPRPVG